MKKFFFIGTVLSALMVLGVIQPVLASFSDVTSANANYDAILYVQQNNIVSGYPDGTFKPNNLINRAEFTKIITGAFFMDSVMTAAHCFSDVQASQWFSKYVCFAKTNGVVGGYPDGTFKPANNINFAEASKIIVVAYGGDFAGAGYPPDQWYAKYVHALENLHAIPTTINSFDQKITRGEMVEMIYRLKAGITTKDSKTFDQISASSNTSASGSTGGTVSFAGSPMIGSCPIFPSDNPWNTDVSNYPLDPNSVNYIASIGAGGHLHPDFGGNGQYGIPYNVVGAGQAMVPLLNIDYADESDPGPYPIPDNAKIENGSDAHVLVVDTGNCKLYELYAAEKVSGGWNAGSAATFDLKSNALRPDGWTSADAAGLPIFPGLVRYDEVAAGSINHAIRFTVSTSQKGYIHPATHQAGSTTSSNAPPMGLRLRMKASYDISNLTGEAKIIATAMKKYGMIVADNGSNWYFQGDGDPRWNDDDLNQLKAIPGSAFEVVQTGTIQH